MKNLTPSEQQMYDLLLQVAIDEAEIGLAEGGIPIGSALGNVQGEILARGHNLRIQQADPTAHGEITCLRNAGRIRSYRGLILASTLMPCCMCAGTVIQFGIETVVVGESQNFRGEKELMQQRGVRVIDLNHPKCVTMMREFIAQHPALWNEDIGV